MGFSLQCRAPAWASSARREWGSLDFQDDAMSNTFIRSTILGRDNNPAITSWRITATTATTAAQRKPFIVGEDRRRA